MGGRKGGEGEREEEGEEEEEDGLLLTRPGQWGRQTESRADPAATGLAPWGCLSLARKPAALWCCELWGLAP